MTDVESPSRLRRALKRFSATPAELEADDLAAERHEQGCHPIGDIGDREVVTLYGQLKTVSLAPRAGVLTLEASLFDGSGNVTVVWLGRRKITGIKPGVNIVVSGRVSCQDGHKVMYNPRYELQA